ncbi:MAG: C10 family peptidase [candidate division Zixibacteria bacterium]|nr:C10 family peptidase [candidate division Zixibacteria bacterium]MDH3937777.1 C10 family peptidase [candidate division Zixibacteria bacterium]MDH4035316.1 C10 family peptidase [candidate division Zixibacteria bacterium]
MTLANIHKKLGRLVAGTTLALLIGSSAAQSAPVDESEAVALADAWYSAEIDANYTKLSKSECEERLAAISGRRVRYLVDEDALLDVYPADGKLMAYVVSYEPSGYVIVAGEDAIQPVVAFDVESEFKWDEDDNENNMMRFFVAPAVKRQIANKSQTVHENWSLLRSSMKGGARLDKAAGADDTEYYKWPSVLWGQGGFYDDLVVPQNGGAAVPTGCVATAMAIKMRFCEWPLEGTGSHSYTDNNGSIQFSHSVAYYTQEYPWENMPTSNLTAANTDVARLMYQAGVAVDMNYEVGGSGAFPTVDDLEDHFGYRGTIEVTADHDVYLEKCMKGMLPTLITSSNHMLVVDGYRSDVAPYFYINAGWSGSSNGWIGLYDLPSPSGSDITRTYAYCSPTGWEYIDGSYAGPTNIGTLPQPYDNFEAGYNAAPTEGGRLLVTAGTYELGSSMTLDKAIRIHALEGTVCIKK